MSRRVQGYLLDWGRLQPGTSAAIGEGVRAYVGDLIVARQNDNHLDAGEPGHTLANGDLLRVESISDGQLTVSRRVRPGNAHGGLGWSPQFTISRAYAAQHCDLGYALTWHTVDGQTVSAGIAVANDSRSRRGRYVAMSRGAQRNEIYAYPSAQEPAESVIGKPPAADPEIARQRKLLNERESAQPSGDAGEMDPMASWPR